MKLSQQGLKDLRQLVDLSLDGGKTVESARDSKEFSKLDKVLSQLHDYVSELKVVHSKGTNKSPSDDCHGLVGHSYNMMEDTMKKAENLGTWMLECVSHIKPIHIGTVENEGMIDFTGNRPKLYTTKGSVPSHLPSQIEHGKVSVQLKDCKLRYKSRTSFHYKVPDSQYEIQGDGNGTVQVYQANSSLSAFRPPPIDKISISDTHVDKAQPASQGLQFHNQRNNLTLFGSSFGPHNSGFQAGILLGGAFGSFQGESMHFASRGKHHEPPVPTQTVQSDPHHQCWINARKAITDQLNELLGFMMPLLRDHEITRSRNGLQTST